MGEVLKTNIRMYIEKQIGCLGKMATRFKCSRVGTEQSSSKQTFYNLRIFGFVPAAHRSSAQALSARYYVRTRGCWGATKS